MLRLLRIELLKLIPYRTFKLLFLLYLLLMVLWLLGGKGIASTVQLTPEQVLGFPNIWNYYALYACYFNIILAILVIFITCNEFTYRTLRQNVIDGMQRTETVQGKVVLIVLLSVISTAVLTISGIIGGMLFSADADKGRMLEHSSFIFAYMVQSLGMMSMGFFFGTVFKRTGLAVIIFLIFLFPVDVILRAGILPDGSGDYMPVATYFLKIVPFPLDHVMSHGEESTPSAPTALSMIVGFLYAILFIAISWMVTRKRDL